MAGAPPSSPQSNVNTSIEQQQLNNFLGPVNGALGGLPVAERNQDYFIVFQQAGGTGPEIIDQTAYFITYLVDSNGNVSKPSEDSVALNNTFQNFEVGRNAIVRNDASTALNGELIGKKLITAIGRQQPILYSQTGSSVNANITSLDFNSDLNQSDTPRFLGNMTRGTYNPTVSTFQVINGFNTPTLDPDGGAANWDQGAGAGNTGSYDITSAGIGDIDFITFNITAGFRNDSPTNSYDVTLRIRRDETVIASKTYTIPVNNNDPFIGDTGDGYLNTSTDPLTISQISGFLNSGNPSYDLQIKFENNAVTYADFIQFTVNNQSPEPTFPAPGTPFWENNSGNNLWLTASAELSANYGRIFNSQDVLDVVETGFNFSPVETPFIVRVGDRIRFEYNKTTEYFVYEVKEPSEDEEGLLRVKLNTTVPTTVNLNNFVLHRVNSNDPAYIILDVKKNDSVGDTQNFNGVILPEFPTKKLKDNLDNIIIGLKERGIITDNEN
jgi:hypothetical protein